MFSVKHLLIGIPLFAVAVLWNSDTKQFLRRLATDCIHNVYATAETITKIPPIPESNNGGVPAYISLCQEWLRQDACKSCPFYM
jgi:hypothetical protein